MNEDKRIKEFKKSLDVNLKIIRDYLPVIIPKDDNDRKIMKLGRDMIECIIKDLNSNNVPDDEIIDVDTIKEKWDSIQKNLSYDNSKEVLGALQELSETYSSMEGDD